MTERKILTLKSAAPKKVARVWKCKPCGAAFTPEEQVDEKGDVRCPNCTARLGKLEDFLADPPNMAKVRARAAAPPKAPPPEIKARKKVVVTPK
jgi:DNA-directed RNA polymerase subunit RPC12/RpoP